MRINPSKVSVKKIVYKNIIFKKLFVLLLFSFLLIIICPFSLKAFNVESTNSISISAKVLSNSPAVIFLRNTTSGYLPIKKGGILVFRGYSYANANIILTKDDQFFASTIAKEDGSFEISLTGVSLGDFNFRLKTSDVSFGDSSIFYKFNIKIEDNSNIIVDKIVFSPLIFIDNENLNNEKVIKFFGKAVPDSTIKISNNMLIEEFSTKSDKFGNWSFDLDTRDMTNGSYEVSAKSILGNISSDYSMPIFYKIFDKKIIPNELNTKKQEEISIPVYPELKSNIDAIKSGILIIDEVIVNNYLWYIASLLIFLFFVLFKKRK